METLTRRRLEFLRRPLIAIVSLALLVTLLPRWSPVRTVVLTAALVPEVVQLTGPLAALPQPERRTLVYGNPADRVDVYLPAGSSAGAGLPAVVLELGVHPQPIDHPDIARLATAICRLGIVVAVPDSTALRELRVAPGEAAHLVDAVLVVAGLDEVDGGRVGLVGFSAGASVALLAAADPRFASRLRFVSANGGYADAQRLLVDVATRTSLANGMAVGWQPDPGIRRDVLALALATLPDGAERGELRILLEPIVSADAPPGGPDAAVLTGLVGDARQMYLLFTAADRPAAQIALDGLSDYLREHLTGISPVSVADRIVSPVFLLHGVPDTAIPVAHADALVDAIGDEVVRFTRFGRFGHGQPGQSGLTPDDAGDIWELSLYLRDIVAAATE